MYIAIPILLIVALIALSWWSIERVIVFQYERGILYSGGKFRRVLEPGAYWSFAPQTTIVKLDLRPRFVSLAGQEVLSADNVGLKVSLAARYQIVDPLGAVHNSASYEEALYLELQLALRELIGAVNIDEVPAKRRQLSAQLMERAGPTIETLGLKLLSVSVKDVMFPGDLKKIFAQVVKAQKEGLAALEKARGESAALRHLANAARMLENNPALMQLRLLQTVGDGSGNTVVLGMPGQTALLPIRRDDSGAAQLEADATDKP